MKTGGSLPHSQQPATWHYPESDESSQCPHPSSWRSSLILSFHLRLGFLSRPFTSGFPAKILYASLLSPIRTACPAHFIFLDLITRVTFGEKYRSWNLLLRKLLFKASVLYSRGTRLKSWQEQQLSRLTAVLVSSAPPEKCAKLWPPCPSL